MRCQDCPDLNAANMPEGWTPRAICCVDAAKALDWLFPET